MTISKSVCFLAFMLTTAMPTVLAVAATPLIDTPSSQAEENDQTDPKKEDSKEGDPVVQFTGNLVMEETDLHVSGRHMDVDIIRTYQNNSSAKTALGPGWDLNWFQRIVVDYFPGSGGTACYGNQPVEAGIYYYNGAARIDVLSLTASIPQGLLGDLPGGQFAKVIAVGDFSSGFLPTEFKIRFADGRIYRFKPGDNASPLVDGCTETYWIDEASDRHGNVVKCEYETVSESPGLNSKRLSRILDTYGRAIDFTYHESGLLAAIQDFDDRRVEYSYDEGVLTSVRSPVVENTSTVNDFIDGKTTVYEYDSSHPQCITRVIAPQELMDANGDPSQASAFLTNTYSSDGHRVVAQQVGGVNASGILAGGRYVFLYEVSPSPIDHGWFVEARKTMSISPNGNVTLRVFDPNANTVLEYRYTGRLDPENPVFDDPEGLLISDYLQMAWSSESEAQDPNLNRITWPHEPRLRFADPHSWVTIRSHNEHGKVTELKAPGRHESYVYNAASVDRFQQGNLLQRRRHPLWGTAPDIVDSYAYEPVFNQQRARVEPRGNDPTYVPPNGGLWSLARYMSDVVFDYQETDLETGALRDVIDEWQIDLNQDSQYVALPGLGAALPRISQDDDKPDVNGDGNTGQVFGNQILIRQPVSHVMTVSSAADAQPIFIPQTMETTLSYNQFSLPISEESPEGEQTHYRYHSEADPSGQLGGAVSSTGGGFLAEEQSEEGQVVTYAYDLLGRQTQITDSRNHSAQTEYNSLDQVVSLTDELGYTTSFLYDGNGERVEVRIDDVSPLIDPVSGWPTGTIDHGAISHVLEYDILGNLVTVDLEADSGNQSLRNVTGYRYDKEGNRILTLKPEWNAGNDSSSMESRIFDERNLLWVESRGGFLGGVAGFGFYSAHDNLFVEPSIAATPIAPPAPGEVVSEFHDYGPHELRTSTVDGTGAVWRVEYDEFNSIAKEIRPPVDGNLDGHYRRLFWDVARNLIMTEDVEYVDGVSDRVLARTATSVDENRRPYQVDQALNTNGIDPALIFEGSLTPGDGFATRRMIYDARGRLLLKVSDDRSFLAFEYDGVGRATRDWDGVGDSLANGTWQTAHSVETAYAYDAVGNPIQWTRKEVRSDGTFVEYPSWQFYDERNLITATVNSLGHAQRSVYDSRKNVVFQSNARTSDTSTSYLLGLDGYAEHLSPPTMAINHHGNTTSYAYDALDQLRLVDRAMRVGGSGEGAIDTGAAGDGHVMTETVLDHNGRVVSQIDDNGHASLTQYDALDRVALSVEADGTVWQAVSYDANGQVTQVADANGSVITNTYDPAGRLSERTIVRGTGVQGPTLETYQWDGLDRLVLGANGNSSVSRVYDSISNLVSESLGRPRVLSKRDHAGRLVECVYPGGRHLEYLRDGIGRLESVVDVNSGNVLVNDNYLGSSRLEIREFFPGPSAVEKLRSYDGVGRVGSTQASRGGVVLDHRTYQWDRNHNKTQRRNELSGVTHSYSYDSANQLVQSIRTGAGRGKNRTIDYTLDGVGNRVSVTGGQHAGPYTMFPVDQPVNQYSHTPDQIRSHDNSGNLTETYAKQGASVSLFPVQRAYDFRNLMVSHSDLEVNENSTYEYDVFGRRTVRVVGGVTTRYFYLDGHAIEERNGAGVTLATYAYGDELDDLLVMWRGSETYGYITDDLGNVHGLVNSLGVLVAGEAYEYEDYGELLDGVSYAPRPAGSGIGNPYFFSSRRLDSESGLYYFRARYFDPIAGRFTTRDPLGLWGDSDNLGNPYSYVGNNPWSFTDPTGLKKKKETPKQRRKRIRKELQNKIQALKDLRDEAKKNGDPPAVLETLDDLINDAQQLLDVLDTYGSILDDPDRLKNAPYVGAEKLLDIAQQAVDSIGTTMSNYENMTNAKKRYLGGGGPEAAESFGIFASSFFQGARLAGDWALQIAGSIRRSFEIHYQGESLEVIPEETLRGLLDNVWETIGLMEGVEGRWDSSDVREILEKAGLGLDDPANQAAYEKGKQSGGTPDDVKVGRKLLRWFIRWLKK